MSLDLDSYNFMSFRKQIKLSHSSTYIGFILKNNLFLNSNLKCHETQN